MLWDQLIEVNLKLGMMLKVICDFTHDYIDINVTTNEI